MIQANLPLTDRPVQYLTDEHGQRTAVVLPIADYQNLLDALELTQSFNESKSSPGIPAQQVLSDLRQKLGLK